MTVVLYSYELKVMLSLSMCSVPGIRLLCVRDSAVGKVEGWWQGGYLSWSCAAWHSERGGDKTHTSSESDAKHDVSLRDHVT